ncbi:hypothetical protein ACLBWT_11150 [Paenibacillus sp. D51F]
MTPVPSPSRSGPPPLRLAAGHLIRWLAAAAIVYAILASISGFRFWSLEAVADQRLQELELPSAAIASQLPWGNGRYSVLLEDEDNGLFHQFLVTRHAGFVWTIGGGSAGSRLDDGIKADYYGSMSSVGSKNVYSVYGQIHDPQAAEVRLVQIDGTELSVAYNGIFYHAVEATPSSEGSPSPWGDKIRVYDASGKLLYELTPERREVRG